jgi:hypothetical protein
VPEALEWFDSNTVFIEQGLRAWAMADPYLVSLIDARWYGPVMEQGSALPCVTVQQIGSADEAPTHQGHSGLERARLQVTVWSSCQMRAIQISERIKRRIDGFRGSLGGMPVGRVAVASTVDMGREPGQNVYQRVVELIVWYRLDL